MPLFIMVIWYYLVFILEIVLSKGTLLIDFMLKYIQMRFSNGKLLRFNRPKTNFLHETVPTIDDTILQPYLFSK